MDLSRGKKIALLIGTLWMPVYMVGFFGAVFALATGSAIATETSVAHVLIPLHFLTLLESFAVIGFYVYLVIKRLDATDNQRLLWLLVVALTSFVGQLVFFFTRVWPAPAAPAAPEPAMEAAE